MKTVISMAQVCLNEGPCLFLEPGECSGPAPCPSAESKASAPSRSLPSPTLLPAHCAPLLGGGVEDAKGKRRHKARGSGCPTLAPFLEQTSKKSWPLPGTRMSGCGSGRAGGMLWVTSFGSPSSAMCNSTTRLRGSVARPCPAPGQPGLSRLHTCTGQCLRRTQQGLQRGGQQWDLEMGTKSKGGSVVVWVLGREVLRMHTRTDREGACPLRAYSPLRDRQYSHKHISSYPLV